MKNTILTLGLSFLVLAGCQSSKGRLDSNDMPKLSFMTEAKPFTLVGARAGEGYFRNDGTQLIFQSERESGNPFYQMYLMDLKTGQTTRVSPGKGKTTCGWIHPTEQKVLFASTHADPQLKQKVESELEERRHPKSRYSWSFDEAYDIYQTDWTGKHIKNLTHSPGYDAEGSYSPDGKWIAFASNRSGFDKNLSEEDKKHFAMDPSFMMDIYIMRADGSDVKRLTTSPGYDGGPFFSPDGTHITYRHFTPDGRTAEVYTMRIDGSEPRQLTRLNAMSWAPFYHPSGDYVIFTTNKQGFNNFELYIVDTQGAHEPVRVSALPGFDGLPVFTPDGRSLLWAHTNEKGEAQLYLSKWDDDQARKALGLSSKWNHPAQPIAPVKKYDIADAKHWVEYLAQDEFAGRMTGNPKEIEYAEALAKKFAELGLKPAIGKSFIQRYEFTSGVRLGPDNMLRVQMKDSKDWQLGSDWVPRSISQTGKFASGGLIFAGYGINAPKTNGQAEYDSYANLDVHRKWVLVFSGLPNDISSDRRYFLNIYSRLSHKALVARQHGALGLLVVDDSLAPSIPLNLKFEGRAEQAGIPVIRISPDRAEDLFKKAGSSRQQWTKKLSTGDVGGWEANEVKVSANVDLQMEKSEAINVLATLPVAGAKSAVVVGAHMDHLGHGEFGNSLSPQSREIHPGADDNASGVAGVIEIAKNLTAKKKAGAPLKQSVVFGLWTGEEIGLLGSTHFLKTQRSYHISSYVNLDMVGRLRDGLLMVEGLGSAPQWRTILEPLNVKTPLHLRLLDDPYVPSDALAFYLKEIPSLFFFTGSHAQYHTPADRPETINYAGLDEVADFAAQVTEKLALERAPVTYQKVEGTAHEMSPSSNFRLYIGTIPDYTQDNLKGVMISGTSKDSPAEKAGLKPGDIIVELGGIKVQNLHDYVYCLQSLKANEPTQMRVLRGGKETVLAVTPLVKSAQ